jgi:hypothetical protein
MNTSVMTFLWSDNWHIEDNRAWFVSGDSDILFEVDMDKNLCISAKKIPSTEASLFRLNPRCIKLGNYVVIMPDVGDIIWLYNLDDCRFYPITIKNNANLRLSCCDFWADDNRIYAVSVGLKEILIIDLNNKKIEGYYDVVDNQNDSISGSVKVGKSIYCLSGTMGKIYKFDIHSRKITTYIFPTIKCKPNKICFDGKNFWICGNTREVYEWDKEKNEVKVFDNLPKSFGLYTYNAEGEFIVDNNKNKYDLPAFIAVVSVRNYIWFIPYQTNKIIYMEKNIYKMQVFEIEDEDETQDSLFGRGLQSKYLYEYVRDGRYIGLFSLKNSCIIEIDTLEMKYIIKKYSFSQQCVNDLKKITNSLNRTHDEHSYFGRLIFIEELINGCNIGGNYKFESVGMRIYKELI